MKKYILITLSFILIANYASAQLGGAIRAANNSNVADYIRRNGNALMTSDSISAAKADSIKAHLPMSNGKLSIDSIAIKSMPSVTASNPSVSTTGSAIPSSATMIGGTDGTNLRAIKTTTSGLIQMDSSLERSAIKLIGSLPSFASTPTVNIGTGGYSVLASDSSKYRSTLKISEFPGVTELNLANIDANTANISSWVDNNSIPQYSATGSGSPGVGFLSYGLATTSAPTNTNNFTYPLSLNLSGGLRVDGSGVTQPVSLSGHDSTTDSRIGVKLIQNPTIANTSFGISGTLPAFAATPTVNIGTTGTIPVSGTFWQATQPVSLASVPSHAVTNAGTFAVQVDSSTQRVSLKIRELPSLASGSNAIGSITNTSFGISGTLPAFASTPTFNIGTGGYAVSASDSTKYRISMKIQESSLPTGAATESTLSTLNGKIPSGLTVNSNRLAIYSPDSIRVFATNGFGSGGGGGGGTQYTEGATTSPATGTMALGRYLSSAPTLSSGQMSPPMLDGSGNLFANISNYVPRVANAASVSTSGYEVYGAVSTTSPSPTTNRNAQLSLTDRGGLRTTSIDLAGNFVDNSIVRFTSYDTIGSVTSMSVTSLNSLASSATVGWQSDRVDNITSTKATDYRIFVKCTMSNTAPASDKTVYVYAAPFFYDGSTWQGPSLGTTSQASGSQGSCTIASAAPNNLVLLGVLSYSTQNMVLQSTFNLSNAFGRTLPDGFSIVLINFTGSAVAASGNVVSYKPVYQTNR